MTIKVFLLLGLFGVAFYAFRARVSSSQLAIRRIIGACVLASGVVAVLFPSATNWLAEKVGVSRGADLLTYGFVVVSLFVWVGCYRRIFDLESRLIQVTRSVALMSALAPDTKRAETAETPE